MLLTHLAKTFKWSNQVDPLLKNECKTCSLGTHFCKVLLGYGLPEAAETVRFCSLMDWFLDIMDIQNAESLECER